MALQTVDHRLVDIALERVVGVDFENFVQSFYSAVMGVSYVPLGGIHDGGADGLIADSIFEDKTQTRFLQASVTPDTKTKVRHTLKRLRQYGRTPKSLIYCTSKSAGPIDVLESDLSDELDCRVTIRDAQYFTHQINNSPQTIQAFSSYLAPSVSFLSETGSASLIRSADALPARTLCVFVGQELERRRGQTQLLEAVTDSLIIWALEGTDPDKKIFPTKDEIEERVINAMPSAKSFFKGVLETRLENLQTKLEGGRRVNFHPKENGFCLPYETRELIKSENVDDEALRIGVSEVFRKRAEQEIVDGSNNRELIELTVLVCHSAVHKTFLRQGLELSLFLSDKPDENELPSIESYVDEAIEESGLKGNDAGIVSLAAINILRQSFYSSSRKERVYLGKLSRTYVLLFLLKNEPRIVEYFRSMSSHFVLYVGSDILVRSLSEHLLPKEDQMTKNALSTVRSAGSKLILTDKALDEVWHHLKVSHYEYVNNFQEIAQFMSFELAKQIRKILIRSYFYARLEYQVAKKPPFSWDRYISQFCTVKELGNQSSRDELREYLINEFKMVFETSEEMEVELDLEERDSLAEKMLIVRGKTGQDLESERTLSRNSATTALRIYQKRKINIERAGSNPLGYKTWWMTQQTRIRNATGELVAKNRSRYMLRPEFILHFLSMMPSSSDMATSYKEVFPSILGVRLGNRMDEKAFRTVIQNAKDVFDKMDDSRARVVLSTETAKLQSDFLKKYDY